MIRGVKRPLKPGERGVQGKTLLLVLGVALLLAAGGVFWAGMHGGSTHEPLSKPGVGFTVDDTGVAAATGQPPDGKAWDGGLITKTVIDHRVRDELRKRILAGWATADDPEVAAAAKQGRFLPAPTGPDGGRMDPKYIQEVVRGDFMPMAEKCYEELLTRHDAAAGRVEMSFTIAADAKLGAIVDDVGIESDGGVADEKMTTCMRESLSTLAFRPPAHGGYVTVVYPLTFAPDDPDLLHDR